MILGLHGKMGAGKNAAASRLPLLTEIPVVEVSYARKLKESVCALFGIALEDLEIWKNRPDRMVSLGGLYDGLGYVPLKERTMTFREFLQRYGTEAHREVFGEDFWLDAALPLDGDYSDALYVVTDCRFQNEADRIRSLGGSVIKIVGPVVETGSHVSEQTLRCDYTIDNTVRGDDFANLDHELNKMLDVVLSRILVRAMEGDA